MIRLKEIFMLMGLLAIGIATTLFMKNIAVFINETIKEIGMEF